jgi:hypothetical protein
MEENSSGCKKIVFLLYLTESKAIFVVLLAMDDEDCV